MRGSLVPGVGNSGFSNPVPATDREQPTQSIDLHQIYENEIKPSLVRKGYQIVDNPPMVFDNSFTDEQVKGMWREDYVPTLFTKGYTKGTNLIRVVFSSPETGADKTNQDGFLYDLFLLESNLKKELGANCNVTVDVDWRLANPKDNNGFDHQLIGIIVIVPNYPLD